MKWNNRKNSMKRLDMWRPSALIFDETFPKWLLSANKNEPFLTVSHSTHCNEYILSDKLRELAIREITSKWASLAYMPKWPSSTSKKVQKSSGKLTGLVLGFLMPSSPAQDWVIAFMRNNKKFTENNNIFQECSLTLITW